MKKAAVLKNLEEIINFINISNETMTLVEWKSPRSFKSFILDLNIIKEHATENIFFHLNKGNLKIVHIRKEDLIYTIGAESHVQYQILEAILEHVYQSFNETYDIKTIFSSYLDVNPIIFKNFKNELDNIMNNFDELNLIQKADVYCPACKKMMPVYIKKSIIKNAEFFPIPIVYSHQGHAILIYVDQNLDIRGVELVSITG
ncbi:MAG: hypothetical protein ACTSU4_01010 [Promethearchaeota archaeon]